MALVRSKVFPLRYFDSNESNAIKWVSGESEDRDQGYQDRLGAYQLTSIEGVARSSLGFTWIKCDNLLIFLGMPPIHHTLTNILALWALLIFYLANLFGPMGVLS